MRARCQICGRAKALMKDGTIVRHYYKTHLCLGTWNRPYEESCEAIQTALNHHIEQDQRCWDIYKRHADERRNEPLGSEFWQVWAEASREIRRLESRLKRWLKTFGPIRKGAEPIHAS